jgi:hypothetical protein
LSQDSAAEPENGGVEPQADGAGYDVHWTPSVSQRPFWQVSTVADVGAWNVSPLQNTAHSPP